MKFDIGIRHTNERALSDIVGAAMHINEIRMSGETASDLFSDITICYDTCAYRGVPIKIDDSLPYGVVDLI